MILINQVLNELENRGVNPSMGEDTIRAVPSRKPSYVMRYVLLAVLVLILLAAVKWYFGHSESSAEQRSVGPVLSIHAPAVNLAGAMSAPVSAPAEAANLNAASSPSESSGNLHGKPLLVVKSEEPVVVPDVKISARRQPKPNDEQVEDIGENPALENPENLQLKKVSPQQRAENEFQKANLALQEGRTNDALAGYEAALLIDSSHKAARRAWVGLLISLKRNDDAERVLQKGIKRDPKDISFSMLMARLQVERNDLPLALETLQKTLPYAENQPDYQAFLAALLQRQSRHDEAIACYQIAIKLVPNNGIWLMGLGISLQALQRNQEAKDIFQRALATNTLNPQLQAFVKQKLKEL